MAYLPTKYKRPCEDFDGVESDFSSRLLVGSDQINIANAIIFGKKITTIYDWVFCFTIKNFANICFYG